MSRGDLADDREADPGAVAQTCKAVTTSAGTIYDCQGYAAALASAA